MEKRLYDELHVRRLEEKLRNKAEILTNKVIMEKRVTEALKKPAGFVEGTKKSLRANQLPREGKTKCHA